tara:strand:+ start:156 stop:797 length:642 start_codon:yes stop_codon:yes gene_type:complete
MRDKTLVTFGDSWPQGSELLPNEKTFGELIANQLGCNQFKNYAHPASSINHLPVQLKSFLQMLSDSHIADPRDCIAIFFLTDPSRNMVGDKNGLWMFQNPSGGFSGPTQDKPLTNIINTNYWKYFYSDKLLDITNNTTIIALQTMCAIYKINDYYVTGWQSVDFWNEVDQTKIYSKTCKDIVQDNKASGGHPNQQGHQLIADALYEWIKTDAR